MVQETGVDAFELNFSCPHGMTERRMGSEMGEHPDLTEEVTSWVTEVAKIPVWAKMTPNITNIREPALAAVRGGATGISAINTILSVIGVDLETLRPMPTVEGYAVPGGSHQRSDFLGDSKKNLRRITSMRLSLVMPIEASYELIFSAENGNGLSALSSS